MYLILCASENNKSPNTLQTVGVVRRLFPKLSSICRSDPRVSRSSSSGPRPLLITHHLPIFGATDDVVKQTTERNHAAVGKLRDVQRETPADTCWTVDHIVFCASAKYNNELHFINYERIKFGNVCDHLVQGLFHRSLLSENAKIIKYTTL